MKERPLLISSHELLEVELISDRVGILYEGVLQTIGRIEELLEDRDITIEVAGVSREAFGRLESKGIHKEDQIGDKVTLRVAEGQSVYQALQACQEESLNLIRVAPRRETLEELFVRIVGAAETERRAAS